MNGLVSASLSVHQAGSVLLVSAPKVTQPGVKCQQSLLIWRTHRERERFLRELLGDLPQCKHKIVCFCTVNQFISGCAGVIAPVEGLHGEQAVTFPSCP